MTEVSGGQLVVRTLRRWGVTQIFSINGGHIGPVYDACVDEGIRIVDTRHEEAAGHMANAWTWLTGEVGVVVTTAGPGVTNAASGIANAWASGSPVVLIGGGVPLRQMNRGGFHEMDQVGFMRPITKRSETALDVRSLPEQLMGSMQTARAGRPGPTFLEVPADVMRARVAASEVVVPRARPPLPRPAGDPEDIDAAVRLLAQAQRPLVLAGSGVTRSRAGTALQALVEVVRLPVMLTHRARGAVPARHPLHFPGVRSVAMREADLLVVVGARFDYTLAFGQASRINPAAKVVQIDIDGADIGHNRVVDVGIVADARTALAQLADALQPDASTLSKRWQPWLDRLADVDASAAQKLAPQLRSPHTPIHPLRLCAEVNAVLERDAIVVVDGGDILSFARLAVDANEPGHWLDAGTFGMLGQGIPFANGAKIAAPDKQVVTIVGDGAFGFNAMEIDTAVRHNLPIVAIVSNNGAWQIEKYTQRAEFGRTVGTDLLPSRYDEMAKALGGYGELVEKPDDIRPALQRALACGVPACLNVMTDPSAVSPDARRLMATVPVEQTLNYDTQ